MKKEFQAVADETRKWGMGASRGGIHRGLLSEDVAPGEAPEGKAIPQERDHKCRASGDGLGGSVLLGCKML